MGRKSSSRVRRSNAGHQGYKDKKPTRNHTAASSRYSSGSTSQRRTNSTRKGKNSKHLQKNYNHSSKKMWITIGSIFLLVVILVPVITVTTISLIHKDNHETQYNFSWKTPSPEDLKKAPNDPSFTPEYIQKNWISLSDEYVSKYGEPTIKWVTDPNVGAGTISVAFPQAISYNGNKASKLTCRFQNFKKIWTNSYDFAWKTPSPDDLKKETNNPIFTANYAYNNWMQIDNDYINKYGKPAIKLTPNHELGKINLKVNFAISSDIYINGVDANGSQDINLEGFQMPANTFVFNWIEPTATDKKKFANDPSFTTEYVWTHWMKIDSRYLNKYDKPKVIITPDNNNGKVNVKIEFNSKSVIYINGNLVSNNTASIDFSGFSVPYKFFWKEPTAPDKSKLSSDSSFTDDYILNHWITTDSAYIQKYGKPKISHTYNDHAGSLTIEITFDENAPISLNGVKISNHVVSKTFNGFATLDLIAKWDNSKDYDVVPSSITNPSNFITVTKNTTSQTPTYKIIKADDKIGSLEVEVTAGQYKQTISTRMFKIDENKYPSMKPHCTINFKKYDKDWYKYGWSYSDQAILDNTTNILDPNQDGTDEWVPVITWKDIGGGLSSFWLFQVTINYTNAANSKISSIYSITFKLRTQTN